jgi:hypothetical protein
MTACYRAFCPTCRHVVEERKEPTFLDPFFLPRRCPSCHTHMGSRWYDEGTWKTEYGEYVRDVSFEWLKPSTWFSGYTWKEIP